MAGALVGQLSVESHSDFDDPSANYMSNGGVSSIGQESRPQMKRNDQNFKMQMFNNNNGMMRNSVSAGDDGNELPYEEIDDD